MAIEREEAQKMAMDLSLKLHALRDQIVELQEREASYASAIKAIYETYLSDEPLIVARYGDLTIAEAAEHYLRAMAKPVAPKPLWEALEALGAATKSKDPVNNLNTSLSVKAEFYRVPEGWALTEWAQREEDEPF